MPKHILIADNHLSVCQDIETKIKAVYPDAHTSIAHDGLQVLSSLAANIPDFIIMDIDMPKMSGLEAATNIKVLYPRIKVIIISSKKNDSEVLLLIIHGVKGFIEKGCSSNIYWSAIETIKKGNLYFSQAILDRLNVTKKNEIANDNNVGIDIEPEVIKDTQKKPLDYGIKGEDLRVLKYICDDLQNKEIKEILCKHLRGVEYNVEHLFKLTNTKSRHQVKAFAIAKGWHIDGSFDNIK